MASNQGVVGSNPAGRTTIVMKNDMYRQARGGWSRIFEISCEDCDTHVCFYQKDGPGPLKRMYLDRFIDKAPKEKVLICNKCGQELGLMYIYEKESRPAYRLFQDAVTKKIVKK